MARKNVLVTGGAGFIGSNFVRHLFNKYKDYKIIVLDLLSYAGNVENLSQEILQSDRFEFWQGNIRNALLVDGLMEKSDIVIHFAAETHVTRSIFDNFTFVETDVLGTQAVVNAVLKNRKRIDRFIHISTSEVYGTAQDEFMGEDHPLNPCSPYAAAKAGADRLVYSYFYTYDIPAVIIRPFNNYGPYQHLEKAVSRFITSCILNDPITVHGKGEAERDWVYVKDICEALDRVLHVPIKKIKGEVINLGTGVSTSIVEIARKIVRLMKKDESIITYVEDRPGQVIKHISSTKKAKELLDWKPVTGLEEGLKSTIDWYQKNPDWWKKQLWMRKIALTTNDGKVVYH